MTAAVAAASVHLEQDDEDENRSCWAAVVDENVRVAMATIQTRVFAGVLPWYVLAMQEEEDHHHIDCWKTAAEHRDPVNALDGRLDHLEFDSLIVPASCNDSKFP